MSKVKKIIIAALIFVVLAIVAMIPIPYVIESPGTAEEVSQFLTISGAKDEDPGSLEGADGVCRAGDRFNVL